MIPDEVIAEIRERVDMPALVGEYVRLQKRGSNYVGLCPFHAEKSPSFSVHPTNRYYYCFGCHASGDPFSFLMHVEGLSFPEAARALAERHGVSLPEREAEADPAQRRARERRQQLVAILESACAFYEAQLAQPAGAVARAELELRGVTQETARHFRLGCAPASWDSLVQHFAQRGVSLALAEELGLIARRRDGQGHYDRFRSRLMFPIRELSGDVVAFSGRTLPAAEGAGDASSRQPPREEPKYVNSPEGPVYHKGSVLFGLHEGRVHIRRHGWAVLCEGNFDVLALHQAGFANTVAPLGTAFTHEQAKLLARFASRVTVLFDGDAAGRKAVHAAYPLLRQQNLAGRVALMPQNEDPDSLVRKHGPDALQRLVDAAPGIVEFLIDSTAESASGDAAGRAAAIAKLGPVLAAVDSRVEIDLYIQRIAQRFGVSDMQALRRELRQGLAQQRGAGARSPAPKQHELEKSAVAPAHSRVKLPKLQAELLGALLDQPVLFESPQARELSDLLTSPELKDLFLAAAQAAQETGEIDIAALLSRVDGHDATPWLKQRLAIRVYEDRSDAEELLRNGIAQLYKQNAELELPKLDRAIVDARRSGDDEQATRLTRQRDALRRTAYEQSRRER